MTPAPKPAEKVKKKRKVKTVPSLHRELWDIFARFIKLRDCLKTTGTKTTGRCISCGRIKDYDDLQAGHFITRRAKSILYHEKNVHAQCENCNGRLKSNPLRYQDAMIKMYGNELVLIFRSQEHSNRQCKKYELEALIVEYQNKVEALEILKGK